VDVKQSKTTRKEREREKERAGLMMRILLSNLQQHKREKERVKKNGGESAEE
jgi:hypothetical protein